MLKILNSLILVYLNKQLIILLNYLNILSTPALSTQYSRLYLKSYLIFLYLYIFYFLSRKYE